MILRRTLTSRWVHIWTNSIISVPIAHIETLNVKTWSKQLAKRQHVCYALSNKGGGVKAMIKRIIVALTGKKHKDIDQVKPVCLPVDSSLQDSNKDRAINQGFNWR